METFGELALLAVSTVVGGVVVGFWHAVAPTAAENLPAGQLKHVFTDEAPVATEYVPAGHTVQLEEPAASA
jgi:hypothetical protein